MFPLLVSSRTTGFPPFGAVSAPDTIPQSMARTTVIPKRLRTGPSLHDIAKPSFAIYRLSGRTGRKEIRADRRDFPSKSHPSGPTKQKRFYFLFFRTIRPLPGAPGPLFDTLHDRAAESADSSPVSSTAFAAKYTRWPAVIPDAAGSNVKVVCVVGEASGVSDAVGSPASVVQNIAYRTVFP